MFTPPCGQALIGRYRRQAEEHLKRPDRVLNCYEAGYDGFWLHWPYRPRSGRLLRANGIENHVMDPTSLPVDRRARRVKTDRVDLGALLRTLMARRCAPLTGRRRGEPQVCRMVRLIRERTQHINRIKGLLMTQGVRDFEPVRRNWHERLAVLHTGDGQDLPPVVKAEVERECKRLWLVIEMIRTVESERKASAAGDGAGKVASLLGLARLGEVSAQVLVNEVFHRAFANRREVAAYCGLSSSPYNSGAIVREQGISRAGNPRTRYSAVELAWL